MRATAGCVALILLWAAAAASPTHAFDGCRAVDLVSDRRVDQADLDALALATVPRGDLDGSGEIDRPDFAIMESCKDTSCAVCLADLDRNGAVGAEDRALLETAFGRDCRADLNRDGRICRRDLIVFEAYAGSPLPLSPASARADLDGDGAVDMADRMLLESQTAPVTDCRMDFNRDGKLNTNDLWFLLASWGPCSQPVSSEPQQLPDPKESLDCGPPPL